MAELCPDGHLICPQCGEHIPVRVSAHDAVSQALGQIAGLVMIGLLDTSDIEEVISRLQSANGAASLRLLASSKVQGEAAALGERVRHLATDAKNKSEPEPD